MKVAIINTWAISNKAIDGTERFVMDLDKALVQDKNEVDVFMFSGKSHFEDGVNYININLAQKLEKKVDVSKYKPLWKYLKENNADANKFSMTDNWVSC